jgi:hypothetical protein
MNEWLDSQKKINSDFQSLLKERIEKANPRRKLSAEETKRLFANALILLSFNSSLRMHKLRD